MRAKKDREGASPRSVRFDVLQNNRHLIAEDAFEHESTNLKNAYNAEAYLQKSSKAAERMKVIMSPAESIFDGRLTGRSKNTNFSQNARKIVEEMKISGLHMADRVMVKNE